MVLVTDVDNRDKIAVYAILSLLSCIFQNLCIPVFSGLHSIYLCLSHKAKEAQTSLSRATFPSSSRGDPKKFPRVILPWGLLPIHLGGAQEASWSDTWTNPTGSFNVEEIRWMTRLLHPISQSWATLQRKLVSAACNHDLCPQLMVIVKGRNVDSPVNWQCFHTLLALYRNRPVQQPHHCRYSNSSI